MAFGRGLLCICIQSHLFLWQAPEDGDFSIHCPTEDLCSGADGLGPSQIQPPKQGLTPPVVMDWPGIGNTMAQMGLFTLQATC